MDELTLTLKVEANTQAIEDIQSQMDKLKTSSKENAEGFGIMDTKLGSMFKGIQEGVEKGVTSFKTLSGAIAATGIGLLLIAVTSLIQYFKTTNEGANIMKGIMSALGQAIREGPKIAFDALKIAFEVLTLPMRTILLVAGNMIQVFKGKESLSEAVKNVKDGIKEMTDEIKKNAQDIAGAGADIKKSYELSKEWEELQQKIAQDKVKETEIETRIAELRDKAQEVKASDLSADEKARQQLDLLNQAKGLIHEKDTIALKDAQAALVIAKEQLALAPKDTEAIKKVQDAELQIQRIKQEGFQADKAIERQKLGASQELQKSKEDEAKELEKIQEKILEDSLKGRQKELAAEDFRYSEEKEKFKDNAKILEALEIEHKANIVKINKDADEKEAKEKDELMAELDEIMKKDAKKNIEDFNGTKAEELKVLETYLQQGLIDQVEYDKEVKKLNDEEAKAQDFLLKLEGEKFKADEDKKLKYLQDSLKKGLISQDQYNKAVKILKKSETDVVLNAASQTLDAVSDAAGKGTIVGKAASIASTTIKTYESAEGAYASMIDIPIIGPILAPIAAAAAVVIGLKNIATIAGIGVPAKQHLAAGGWIGGNDFTGDHVPVQANSGEYMVNAQAMQNPQMASAIMSMNANPHGGMQANQSISEERMAEIASNIVKAVPVQVTEHQITLHQQNVAVREGRFTVQ